MYHSITFGNKNTWDSWHIVPSSRPVFNPPELKMRTLEVPGASSYIDLTETPAGYPVFNNRKGSFEFYVLNEDDDGKRYGFWYDRYTEIMNYLHGQKMKAYLEDDPLFYYIGRFTVNEWKSDKDYSKIVIDYDVDPYKWSRATSAGGWLWDPFNFYTGSIRTEFKDIPVPSYWIEKPYTSEQFGRAPICPTIESDKPITVVFTNERLGIMNVSVNIGAGKKTYLPRFVMYGDEVKFKMKSLSGTAKVTIDFREGDL